MRITKFGHACVRLEKNGRAVVIGPGVMTADPDALTVVGAPTLLVPGQAPWLTVPDMIGYLRRMSPCRAYATHDGLLNEWGLKVLDDVLAMEAKRAGTDIRRPRPGESIEL